MSIRLTVEVNRLKEQVLELQKQVAELKERKKPGPKPKAVVNG